MFPFIEKVYNVMHQQMESHQKLMKSSYTFNKFKGLTQKNLCPRGHSFEMSLLNPNLIFKRAILIVVQMILRSIVHLLTYSSQWIIVHFLYIYYNVYIFLNVFFSMVISEVSPQFKIAENYALSSLL